MSRRKTEGNTGFSYWTLRRKGHEKAELELQNILSSQNNEV